MKESNQRQKPVLLNLSNDVFDRVVIASHEQNVTKTQFLRQSVERNLNHFEKNERLIFQRLAVGGLS